MNIKQRLRSYRSHTFLFTMLLMVLVTFIIAIAIFLDAQSIMVSDAEIRNVSTAKQMQRTMDVIFRESSITTGYIFLDPNVERFMNSGQGTESSFKELSELTATYRYTKDYYFEIGFYSSSSELLYIANQFNSFARIKADAYADTELCQYIERMQPFENGICFHRYRNHYPYVLTIVKKNRSGEGATFLSIAMSSLTSHMPDNPDEQCYIAKPDGTIVYSLSNEEMGKNASEIAALADWDSSKMHIRTVANGSKYLISSIQSSRYNWYYISVRDISSLGLSTTRIAFLLLIVTICGCLGLGVSSVISRNTSRPLKTVIDMLDGKITLATTFSHSETELIAKKLAAILISNQELQENLDFALNAFNGLQRDALQYQINPHFLFNTLNLISVCVAREFGAQHEVVLIISQLSDILRYSLNTDTQLVSLQEELNYCKKYVFILQKRHRGSIKVKYEIPKSILENQTIRLSLQPLIENAFYHGLMPKGGGTITIGAQKNWNYYDVWVKDDGVGATKEEVQILQEKIQSGRPGSSHIGVANVHKRIQSLFGEEFGVTVTSDKGNGFTTTIRLPMSI